MKKFILSLFFSVILILPALADAQTAGFYIKSYDYYAYLGKNKVMTVQETIDVEFIDRRHGIYRSLPEKFSAYRYDGKNERFMEYKQEYSSVSTSPDKNTTDAESSVFTIKIGDENKTIIGPHTYTIKYKCVMYDDRIDLSDFFYYSPLGAYWETDIEQFNFRIDFEEPIPADTQFELYSGNIYSEANGLNVDCHYNQNCIWGKANKIPEGNAITLFCELPDGYFVGAKKVSPFWTYLCGILSLASCLLTFFFIIKAKHKSPVQTVEFYPPNNISAAEVGFIIDNEANDSDLMALYPEWAQKGYIQITEDKKKVLTFTKLKELPEDAPEYQKILFKKTFSRSKNFTVKNISSSYISELEKAKESLHDAFDKERSLYEDDFLSLGLLYLCSFMYTLFLCISSPVSRWDNLYLCMLVIPFHVLGSILNKGFYSRYFRQIKPVIKTTLMILFCIFMGGVSYGAFQETEFQVPLVVVYVLSVLYLLVCIFHRRIIKRTDYNLEVTGKLLGLKEFIKTAEMPRLKELVAENPCYYYDIFPYAMVFNLADKWAKQFTDIPLEAPVWFKTYSSTALFSAMSFNHSFQTEVTKSMASAIASKSSSGSSGGSHGGHSGGGGGGGGGGGW